ncbi:RpiR family transcriptional regulator [Melghiribacillus thermohalophilus]|uniref:RpiR family transcriptional regulator n=1 Tax=Melghiribacillus thermohalophilus TaxID=1324956 RepID=A0A4V2V1M4_9BACI|nr:MurR/RpiR family transcriptional regulator [Melghiribacillus thermohalophilus]TCT21752.1 RpiR family transcriptional regulator [Melghiribacillus thermohalophilus]
MEAGKIGVKGRLTGVINSYYPSLTKSEQKVAEIVLEKMDQVMYFSVTDLADEADVGDTTVLRFCRKIGFKGYQEFKLAIAKDLGSPEENHETEEGMIKSIALNNVKAIEETVALNSEDKLETALNMMEKANSILFFGVGTSGLTALDAKNRFLRIGKRTEAVIDSHIQAMTAATLDKDDIVVGISVSGSTMDTIDSLKLAKESGASVIAITYHARSPITKVADLVLLSGGKESPLEGGSLAAKISQLFIIDLLCTGIALRNKEQSLKYKELTARAVINKIY